jgi:hypothetical protein
MGLAVKIANNPAALWASKMSVMKKNAGSMAMGNLQRIRDRCRYVHQYFAPYVS